MTAASLKREPRVMATAPVPQLAPRVGEAAAALGVSDEWFAVNVAPQVRRDKSGRVQLVTLRELER